MICLICLLAEYSDELKFCKQLFTHRKNPEMNLTFILCDNQFDRQLLFKRRRNKKLVDRTYLGGTWNIIRYDNNNQSIYRPDNHSLAARNILHHGWHFQY